MSDTYKITTENNERGYTISSIWPAGFGAATFLTDIRKSDGVLLAGILGPGGSVLWATDFTDVEGEPYLADVAPSALINGF